MIFGCCNEQTAESGSLMRRVYGQLTEVATDAADLGIDTSKNMGGAIFGEENCALLHHGGKTEFVGARAIKEDFDREGGVDEGDQTRAVGFQRRAEVKWGAGIDFLDH